MPKISSYPLITTVTDQDLFVISDSSNNDATKSLELETLKTYIGDTITSLTTTGTSGPATFTNGVLNIPQYSGGGGAVDSVNGQTGAVVLTTSDLTNDSGYIEGTTTSQTAITEIKTLTSAEYAAITPAADVMYVIV